MAFTTKLIKSILLTALIAGTLDLVGAIISFKLSRGSFPMNILKYIAGGIFGGKAMEGGTEMQVLGGLFHFLIAGIWTTFYYMIYPYIKWLHQNIWLNAIVYGVFIWCIMNLLVLPNSAWKAPINLNNKTEVFKAALILIVCVALPISYRAKSYFRQHR